MNTLEGIMNSKNDYSKENIIVKEEILEDLHKGICKVTFTKKDGTERVMKCTLVEEYLPKIEAEKVEKNATSNSRNDEVYAVWDVEKDAWRSFRWDSVKIAYLDEHIDGHVYAEVIEAEVSAIEGHPV